MNMEVQLCRAPSSGSLNAPFYHKLATGSSPEQSKFLPRLVSTISCKRRDGLYRNANTGVLDSSSEVNFAQQHQYTPPLPTTKVRDGPSTQSNDISIKRNQTIITAGRRSMVMPSPGCHLQHFPGTQVAPPRSKRVVSRTIDCLHWRPTTAAGLHERVRHSR